MRRFVFLLLAVCTVPSAIAQHLYLADDNPTVGTIRQYTLPVNGSSTPNFAIPINFVISVETDVGGTLAAGELGGNIAIFAPPLSAASTPYATFKSGGAGGYQVAFTASSDFFVAALGQVSRFNHPFSNASVPVQTISATGLNAYGAALDASQNLYISNSFTGVNSNLYVYAPPYDGMPLITLPASGNYRKIAISGTQLAVCASGPGTGRVDVYSLPLTSLSTPAFAITNGVNTPEAVSFDSAGNLYIGNLVGGSVTVYAPPLSAASAPITTLSVSGISIFGMTVEKIQSAVLPAVASAAGAFGSFFRTAVQLNNSSASTMTGRIVYHRAGASGTDTDPAVSYSLTPAETTSIPDLVQAAGQSGLGSADLIPTTGGFPTVVARVFNDAGSKGTTGFTEDVPKLADALQAGDQYTLIVPSDLTRFRYNIGVRSLAAGATLTVTQRNSAGTTVRAASKTYAPNFFEQVDAATFLGGAISANDSIVVSIGAGSAFIYGATTDNTTQDPSVQLGRK